MNNTSILIPMLALGASLALPAGTTAAQQGTPATAPVIPPQIIIAPTEVRSDPTLARGCWVRLFPETGFKGENNLTVAGPVELPSLHTPAGDLYWKPKAESVIVGPKATVTMFEDKSYRGPRVVIKPASQHAQLRSDLKLMQSVDSLKVACAK